MKVDSKFANPSQENRIELSFKDSIANGGVIPLLSLLLPHAQSVNGDSNIVASKILYRSTFHNSESKRTSQSILLGISAP